jgi:IS30 family transposase
MKTPKPKEWTAAEKRMLSKLAKQGASSSKIAAELGRYAGSVKRMARSAGVLLKK